MNIKINNFRKANSRFIILLVVLFSIISCGPTSKDTAQTTEENAVPALLQELNNTREIATPAPVILETDEQTSEETNSEEINTLVTINPPHGEPGHRCDIAVGAPLDSPVPNTEIQATTNTPAPATPVVNTPVNNSGRRVGPTIENLQNFRPSQPINSSNVSINPPHGQPGHRCDIAVGDPLPTASVNSNVMVNPPHGQPNHRCDIPVGDPLPS